MKFIGHLDMLKLFQRAVKRAGLPISYSTGFNPHQIMSFASPLALGTESIGEYCDFRLDEKIDCLRIKDSLNTALPEGMTVLEVCETSESSKNSASIIDAALYEIVCDKKINRLDEVLADILNSKEIIIKKTVKDKTKEVNIREDIYKLYLKEENVMALISAGSKRNLKPELLIEYIYNISGLEFIPIKIKSKRIEMYTVKGGEFIPLKEAVGL